MSRSLIRKNQLHPDIADLISGYGDNFFVNNSELNSLVGNFLITGQNIVLTTGDQTISGIKNFATRPIVNGTGVLLSGEASELPDTIVYTTGNQNISGKKRFTQDDAINSHPFVNGSFAQPLVFGGAPGFGQNYFVPRPEYRRPIVFPYPNYYYSGVNTSGVEIYFSTGESRWVYSYYNSIIDKSPLVEAGNPISFSASLPLTNWSGGSSLRFYTTYSHNVSHYPDGNDPLDLNRFNTVFSTGTQIISGEKYFIGTGFRKTGVSFFQQLGANSFTNAGWSGPNPVYTGWYGLPGPGSAIKLNKGSFVRVIVSGSFGGYGARWWSSQNPSGPFTNFNLLSGSVLTGELFGVTGIATGFLPLNHEYLTFQGSPGGGGNIFLTVSGDYGHYPVNKMGFGTHEPSTNFDFVGDVKIDGNTNFLSRPNVNGTGVLLSGESVQVDLSSTVRITGNQVISGQKTFLNNINYGTGSGFIGSNAHDFGFQIVCSDISGSRIAFTRGGTIPIPHGYGIVFDGGNVSNKKGYFTVGSAASPLTYNYASLDWTNRILSGQWKTNERLLVNGSGVLLQGEASISSLSNVVFTTGDQTISGAKAFTFRPTVNGTGILLSGESNSINGITTSSLIGDRPWLVNSSNPGGEKFFSGKNFNDSLNALGFFSDTSEFLSTGIFNEQIGYTMNTNLWNGFKPQELITGWSKFTGYIELDPGSFFSIRRSGNYGGYPIKWFSSDKNAVEIGLSAGVFAPGAPPQVVSGGFALYVNMGLLKPFNLHYVVPPTGSTTESFGSRNDGELDYFAFGYLPKNHKYLYLSGSAGGGFANVQVIGSYGYYNKQFTLLGDSFFSTRPLINGTGVLLSGEAGSSTIINTTYSGLTTLKAATGLIPGQLYRISDFHLMWHNQSINDTGIKSGLAPEPLIVLALSGNKISHEAKSELYPQDTIYYDIDASGSYSWGTINNNTAIPNFKGWIYRRIDHKLNIDIPWDWRNITVNCCRPNMTSIGLYNSATTYNLYSVVKNASNKLYYSIQNNNTNNSLTNTNFWLPVSDFTEGNTYFVTDESYGFRAFNKNGNFVNLPADTSTRIQQPTFTSSLVSQGAFQLTNCNNIKIEGGSSNVFLGNNLIISNTIGNDFSSNTIGNNFYSNTIGNSFSSNTIGNLFYANTIGNSFYFNTIGNSFYSNTIGNSFYFNIIGNDFYSNTIGNSFNSNTIGDSFYSNTIGNLFYANTIENFFYFNTIGNSFDFNTIGNGFDSNTIGNLFNSNTIGDSFYSNTIGNLFYANTIGNSFRRNTVEIATSINITGATHVYNNYNTTIFANSNHTVRLSYFNSSDQLVVTDPTA